MAACSSSVGAIPVDMSAPRTIIMGVGDTALTPGHVRTV